MASIRVDMTESKRTIKSRVDRGSIVAGSITNSTLCQEQPEVQAACTGLAKAATDLETADKAFVAAEAAVEVARAARDSRQAGFDSALAACAAKVEQTATTESEVVGVGLVVLERASYSLEAPIEVTARWNAAKGRIEIHVTLAPGASGCVVDLSPGGGAPESWRRLPGISARPKVSGLEPGVYLVRAAAVRGSEQSEFTAPVTVIVKAA